MSFKVGGSCAIAAAHSQNLEVCFAFDFPCRASSSNLRGSTLVANGDPMQVFEREPTFGLWTNARVFKVDNGCSELDIALGDFLAAYLDFGRMTRKPTRKRRKQME